jgi:sulfite reductase (ferredoxin)
MSDQETPGPAGPSPVEKHKTLSNYLRGTIGQELSDGKPSFGKENVSLLKHHGTYQQDDRDARAVSRAAGGKKSDKEFIFMVRSKIPGGKLTAEQLLAELDLADELGNTTLRVTTRQGLQLHGVIKQNLQQVIARINEVQLTTLGACGDVNRNVMCCPAPHCNDPVHEAMQALADRLAAHFAPRTGAYHEIWLTDPATGEDARLLGEAGLLTEAHATTNGQEVEPIYGNAYLPRKFKMAIALPGDNCVDVYCNDLGFLAICENYRIIGYNVLVGGGQGVTPSAKKTFPALAKRLAFVTPHQVVDVATAIVKVYRDFGNRADRKTARIKYLIHNWGLEAFKAKVEEYYGARLPEPHPDDVWRFDDHLGWAEQGDGRWFYGLNVENGRIKDEGRFRLKTALRQICRQLRPRIRLTPHQSILFTQVQPGNRDTLTGILREHGVPLSEEISEVRRWSMACPAMPTCGLAVTDSERALPGMIDQLEVELAKLGLASEQFTLRMTGCPNGCARPYNSDIGLVGKTLGQYTIFVGGRLLGDRLNFIYKDLVPTEEVVPTLMPLFAYFKQARENGETFGDFCHRRGQADLLAWSEQYAAATA